MIPVAEAIEAALRSQPDEWDESRLHVTDLAVFIDGPDGKCERQLQLRAAGADKKRESAGRKLMFDHSHRIHQRMTELLQKGLKKLGSPWVVIAEERPLDKLLPVDHPLMMLGVKGTPDVILGLEEDGGFNWSKQRVLDYKTVRSRKFQYMDGPSPAHVLQVRTYCWALDAESGMILYIDREGQNAMQAYEVERDDKYVERAIRYAQAVWSGVPASEWDVLRPVVRVAKNGKVYLNRPWQCDYCDYDGVSCPGAQVPVSGYVGMQASDGGLRPKRGLSSEVARLVDDLLLDQD